MKNIFAPYRLYVVALPVAVTPLLWAKFNFLVSIGTILLFSLTLVLSALVLKMQEGPLEWKMFSVAYLWLLSAPGFFYMLQTPSKSIIAGISFGIVSALLLLIALLNFTSSKRPIFSDFYTYLQAAHPVYSISFILFFIMRD